MLSGKIYGYDFAYSTHDMYKRCLVSMEVLNAKKTMKIDDAFQYGICVGFLNSVKHLKRINGCLDKKEHKKGKIDIRLFVDFVMENPKYMNELPLYTLEKAILSHYECDARYKPSDPYQG